MKSIRPKITESDILNQVRDFLRIKGFYVIRIQQGLGCHKGISDLIAVGHGNTFFLEIKKPGGKLSDHQIKFAQEIISHGGRYYVVTSIDDLPLIMR